MRGSHSCKKDLKTAHFLENRTFSQQNHWPRIRVFLRMIHSLFYLLNDALHAGYRFLISQSIQKLKAIEKYLG